MLTRQSHNFFSKRTEKETHDVVGVNTINSASNGLGSSEDLLGATSKVLGKGLGLHNSAKTQTRLEPDQI